MASPNPGKFARQIIDRVKNKGDAQLLQRLTLEFRQKRNHRYALWQKDPSIVDLESQKFILQKSGYIHMNPVRAELVDHPAKWRWSSYHAYLPHEPDDVPIEIDRKPYWTEDELGGNIGWGVGR